MSYKIYFRAKGKKYKLPVNPEEISITRELKTDTYEIVGGSELALPSSVSLKKISFEVELPSNAYHYNTETRGADYYIKMLENAQNTKEPIRFITSNGINKDLALNVLVISLVITEKAGEEGDKYVKVELLEYKRPNVRYKAVEELAVQASPEQAQVSPEQKQAIEAESYTKQAAKKSKGKKKVYTKKDKTYKTSDGYNHNIERNRRLQSLVRDGYNRNIEYRMKNISSKVNDTGLNDEVKEAVEYLATRRPSVSRAGRSKWRKVYRGLWWFKK